MDDHAASTRGLKNRSNFTSEINFVYSVTQNCFGFTLNTSPFITAAQDDLLNMIISCCFNLKILSQVIMFKRENLTFNLDNEVT